MDGNFYGELFENAARGLGTLILVLVVLIVVAFGVGLSCGRHDAPPCTVTAPQK